MASYRFGVPQSLAAASARTSARMGCVAMAFALSLMCAVLGVAASTASMTDMGDLVSASGSAAPHVAVPVAGPTAQAASLAQSPSPVIASMCDTSCAPGVTGMCTVAMSSVVSVLVLFLASRRETFLGLLARVRRLMFALDPQRGRPPWTVLSLSSLCVSRV